MSAAGARRAAGAGHQIARPRSRAADSAPGLDGPFGAGHGAQGGPKHARGRPPSGARRRTGQTLRGDGGPATVTELRLRGLEVTELRMTQVRAIEAAGQRPHGAGAGAGAGAQAGGAEAGREVTEGTVATGSRPDRARQARPGAVRLTRRGRVVVAGLALALTTAVVVLIWLGAAGGAAAADHGLPARAVYQGLTRVVVRPGQTLWSIAAAAEPSADPRVVIQQIIEANALSGATIGAGQLLWVPKG